RRTGPSMPAITARLPHDSADRFAEYRGRCSLPAKARSRAYIFARAPVLRECLQRRETSVLLMKASFRDAWRTSYLPKDPEQGLKRIVEPVNDALLQRNDRVVGDRDVFRTNFRTTLCDIAESDSLRLLQLRQPVFRIQRMHLERGRINEQARPDELL